MPKQKEISLQSNSQSTNEVPAIADVTSSAKRQFVEPELSMPVDVLEATTFFQAVTSGTTN